MPMTIAKSNGTNKPRARRKPIARRKPCRTTSDQRGKFLDALALSANVTAAAKSAKLTTTIVYRLRASDAPFRAAWHSALCEGYARLETELLAEALAPVEAGLDDMLVKARQYKQRLALALLAAHRSSVRGERGSGALVMADETKGAKMRLVQKIGVMAQRTDASQPVVDTDQAG